MIFDKIVSLIAGVSLSITLIGVGLAACAAPPLTTQILSESFSQADNSPFTKEDLVKAALATRDYTVGSNDREALYQVIYEINRSAEEAGSASVSKGAPVLPFDNEALTPERLASSFQSASDVYVLTDDALSHLDDVFEVITTARFVFIVIAVLALLSCIFVAIRGGGKRLGTVFLSSSLTTLALFALLALWVILDFNGFFSVFHSLFFASGSWTFSANSLLITMYPTEFWIGMGAVWLVATLLGCLALIIAGIVMKRRAEPSA